MARRLVGGGLLPLAVALVASGCVVEVFEPFGSDFALEGTWTVNGQPASAETCGEAETVRLVFYEGGSPYFFDEVSFACEEGRFATGQIFAYGSYTVEWQILDAGGTILDRSGDLPLVVEAPAEVVTIPRDGPYDFTVVAAFTPFGDDFSLSGSWTVNGETPSADACGQAEMVRIAFFEGETQHVFDELTFPCEDGIFETDGILAYGSYEIEWQILNAASEVLDRSSRSSLEVAAPAMSVKIPAEGAHDFTVEPPAFDPSGSDDSLSADWTINGMLPTVDLCASTGIATVEIRLYAEDDTEYADGYPVGNEPCSAGTWASVGPIIRDGRYLTEVVALGPEGTVVDSHRSEFVLDTTAVTHAMLMTAPFEVAVVTSLTVSLGWDTDPAAGSLSEGTCSEAGVATFSYMLTDVGTGSTYDEMYDIACGESVVWDDIPPGEYSLYAEGADAGGVKAWSTTCTGLTVADGVAEAYDCAVPNDTGG